MSNPAFRVENLGKRYRIGRRARYFTLRDRVAEAAAAAFRRLGSGRRPSGNGSFSSDRSESEFIWALKDVSFEIAEGEVAGIIGRNGAGKSTLLKILARIIEPTEGEARIYGRVGSLLEVGTGFHPELTGRENIYLSGAILGMKKHEIRRKFDEIVAFAEVEKFLETPVKHYSTGMYMRLAFSVAAHLETEILLVDEVLAVGDAVFQSKCLGKMGEAAKGGRTVLFVSHNTGAITNLCREVFWIDAGRLKARGAPAEIVQKYFETLATSEGETDLADRVRRKEPGTAHFTYVATKNAGGDVTSEFKMGDDIVVEFELRSEDRLSEVRLSLGIKSLSGTPVFHLVDEDCGFRLMHLSGTRRVRATIPRVALYPGGYLLSCWVGDASYRDYDYVQDCLSLRIRQSGFTRRNFPLTWNQGLVLQGSHWEEIDSK